MPGHAFWKGFLRISLVSVPVKAYSATRSEERISLNQLHAECKSRIQYRKTCPVHGEIRSDEIVSGYEFDKGQYVVIDTDELDKLRTEKDRAINVETFAKAGSIDDVQLSGKSYYVLPDAPMGQKPYQVIVEAMAQQRVEGIAQVVLGRREQLVVVRPKDGVLVMSTLSYAKEVKQPDEFAGDIHKETLNKQELQLASQLIGSMTEKKLDLEKFPDVYNEKLSQLIDAKVAGKELVATPEAPAPKVINLMDAIKASMKQVKTPPAAKKATTKEKQRTSALRQVVATARKTKPAKKKSG
ncbi:MAG TPA: Ku protein [Caulifigura sp.]|nr:Ku protein [Caulifigura sp.]